MNGFTTEDDVYAYADKVQQIVKDKDFLRKVGAKAQETLYETWRDSALCLLDTYNEVIKEYNYKHKND